MKASPIKQKKVWDLPIRLIHWTLVILITLLWWTAENEQMDNHRLAGYGVLALLVFRLYWGFAGSNTARFSHFVKTPNTAWQYGQGLCKSEQRNIIGHNPLGGYSVLLLLALLIIQVGLGLFAIDVDGWEAGPLNHYVSFEAGRLCATWHEYIFNALLAWIVLHVVAVMYYVFVRKQNIIKAMFTGNSSDTKEGDFQQARPVHYYIALGLAMLVLWWFI